MRWATRSWAGSLALLARALAAGSRQRPSAPRASGPRANRPARSASRSPPRTALPTACPASPCSVSAVTVLHHSPRRIAAASALPRSNSLTRRSGGRSRRGSRARKKEHQPQATGPAMGGAFPVAAAAGGSRARRGEHGFRRTASPSSIASAHCSSPTPRSSCAIPSWSRTRERSIARRKSSHPEQHAGSLHGTVL